MTSSAVLNIVNSTINKGINAIYNNHNSIFDILINSLDINLYDENHTNIYDWYNLYISNNPIEYSQKQINLTNNLHINAVLFFHNPPPKQFKKEDLLIFKKHVFNQTKILFDYDLSQYWLPSDNKWEHINYGIPDLGPPDFNNKPNDILILNLSNNNNIKSLYEQIKNKTNFNTEIVNSAPNNLESLADLCYQSKICINFENNINAIFAAACGCFIISVYNDLNSHLTHYKKISNINELQPALLEVYGSLDSQRSNIIDQRSILLEKFPFDIFAERINSLFIRLSKEKFVL